MFAAFQRSACQIVSFSAPRFLTDGTNFCEPGQPPQLFCKVKQFSFDGQEN